METQTYLQAGELAEDYVFDDSVIDFNDSNPLLKLNRPAALTYLAHFENGVNADYSRDGGSLVGTGTGNPGVDEDELILNAGQSVDYSGVNNTNQMIQKGCVRFYWKPAYSGFPAAIQYFITLTKAAGDFSNIIQLNHEVNGNLSVYLYDKNQTPLAITSAVYTAVADQRIEIEYNFDITLGFQKLFIDGILVATTTITGLRDSNISLIRLGRAWDGSGANTTGRIHSFLLFDEVQHTTNYTPTLFNNYPVSSPSISAVMSFNASQLINFSFSADEPTGTFMSFVIIVDGVRMWFNGSAWVESSGAGESNTSVTNEQLLLLSLNGFAELNAIFYFNSNGIDTPQLLSYTFGFLGYGLVTLIGSFINPDGTVPSAGYITAQPTQLTLPANTNVQVDPSIVQANISDEFGTWAFNQENENRLLTGVSYIVKFVSESEGYRKTHSEWRVPLTGTGEQEFNNITKTRIK